MRKGNSIANVPPNRVNRQFQRLNEANGIANGLYPQSTDDYAEKMPEGDRTQAVLGAYNGIFKSSYKFPPYNPDSLIGRQGYDFMEDMLKMSVCWATFNLKRYSVLKDSWTVEPAIVDPMSSDHEESKFYADSLRYCLDNIVDTEVDYPQDFAVVLFDMMMAAWLGYRCSEIQFRNLTGTNMDGLDGKYGFTGFWTKTNKQIGFEVDHYTLNPKRFVSYTPDGGYNADIHPEKVWCYTHAQSANDPTGQGDARRVYKNYFALDVLQKLWAIALERWGAPVFIAQYPAGNLVELQNALSAMNEIRQGQSPIIPDNIKYELITCPTNVFDGFQKAGDWHVRQIAMSIHSNTLSTGEGEHGATSAGSDVHQDSGQSVYDYLSQRVCSGFNMQVIRRWMRYNWGEKSLALMPKLNLRKAGEDPALLTAMNTIFNSLVQMGNMPPTSKLIREGLNIAPIDADEEKLLEEQKQAQEEAQQQMIDAKMSGQGKANMSDHDMDVWVGRLTTAIMARNEIEKREGKAA